MKKNMKVGDKASLSKVFTEEEVIQYSEISTDTNPIHLDESYASSTIFGKRIGHGMLLPVCSLGLSGLSFLGRGPYI